MYPLALGRVPVEPATLPIMVITPTFDQSYYQGSRFTDLTLTGEALAEIEFEDCTFTRCRFVSCTFRRCRFADCHFQDCDLSNSTLPNSTLRVCAFDGCKLVGLDWTVTGGVGAVALPLTVEFRNCVLDLSSLFGMAAPGLVLTRCHAYEVDLREADLRRADFTNTDLLGSLFSHTKLDGADFSGAINYAIDPTANSVRKARFSLPEAASLLRGFDIVIDA